MRTLIKNGMVITVDPKRQVYPCGLKYLRETGRTDVRYLMQLGILDPQWILIHGIHATELDIEQMARVGCSFVYTPSSEAIRGGGISPFANAHRAGVNVALGTDGPRSEEHT